MKHYRLSLPLIALCLAAAHPAWAIRPLGPPKATATAKKHSSQQDGKQLLRDAQQRIAPHLHAPAATQTAASQGNPSAGTPRPLQIPNLPGSNPGPAPSTLGRPYSQEELTRRWAPYTYP